jgi:peptidoglycan/LPS O-acetylase OafA/YrhL
MSVLVCHLYYRGVLHAALSRLVPSPIEAVLDRTDLGVYVFFVISGFVTAYSLRQAHINWSFLTTYAVRRSVRLDPPYWVAMLICCVVSAARLRRVVGVAWPTASQLLLNAFYLQDLTGGRRILSVSWTLCYEVQFYFILALCLALAQYLERAIRWPRGRVILCLTWPASMAMLAFPAGWVAQIPGLFTNLWYSFYIGVLICWVLTLQVRPVWLWTYASALGVVLATRWDGAVAVVLATSILVYGVGRLGRLATLLNWRWLQWFGRISYSVYLMHPFIALWILDFGYQHTGYAVLPAFGWVGLALLVTLIGSWLLHRLVESPCLAWAKSLKESRWSLARKRSPSP